MLTKDRVVGALVIAAAVLGLVLVFSGEGDDDAGGSPTTSQEQPAEPDDDD